MADEAGEMPTQQPEQPTAVPGVIPEPQPDLQKQLESTLAELNKTKAALKDANKEAAERRIKLSELEKLEEARKQAEMSEMERLQAQLKAAQEVADGLAKKAQETQALAQKQLVENHIIREATNGFLDVNDVIMALSGKVAVDENTGLPVGIKEALDKLAQEKPHWVKKSRPVVQPTNPGEQAIGNGTTEAQLRNLVYGESARGFLTPTYAREHGGGVVFNSKE